MRGWLKKLVRLLVGHVGATIHFFPIIYLSPFPVPFPVPFSSSHTWSRASITELHCNDLDYDALLVLLELGQHTPNG